MKKSFILLFLVIFLLSGCGKTKCEQTCDGANESCFLFFTILFGSFSSYTPYPYSYSYDQTHSEAETSSFKNDTFYNAENISMPVEGSTTTLNGNISPASDIDIYYISNSSSYSSSTVNLTVKLANGSPTCELWSSSLKDTNITSNPDTFLVSKGIVNSAGTTVSFASTAPYAYLKCTNTTAGIYSIKFIRDKQSSSTATPSTSLNSLLPLVTLICSGAKDSCIRDCNTNKK